MSDGEWGEPIEGGTWDLKTQGPIIGVYQGYKEVLGDYGTSRLHTFMTEQGPTKVWGKTHADRLLEGRTGEMIKLVLLLDDAGEPKKMDLGGGKKMVQFELYSKGRPNAPELPSEPLPGPGATEGPAGKAEADTIRAQRVAMAMKDAQIDDEMRGDLIDFYTFGGTRSARELDDKQAEGLYKLVQKIRVGKLFVRYDEAGKLFLSDPSGVKVNA